MKKLLSLAVIMASAIQMVQAADTSGTPTTNPIPQHKETLMEKSKTEMKNAEKVIKKDVSKIDNKIKKETKNIKKDVKKDLHKTK